MKQKINYKNPDLLTILKLVELTSNVQNISKRSRDETLKNLRFVYMKLSKRYTKCSLAQIGHVCGGLDHASVLHGIKRFDQLYETPRFSYESDIYDEIIGLLGDTLAYRNQKINYRDRFLNYLEKRQGVVKRINYKLKRLKKDPMLHKIACLDEEDYKDVSGRINAFMSMNRIKSKYNFQNQEL
jgi:uncharacterized protein YunC (DUF1805 family)